MSLRVVFHQFSENSVNLHGQFTGGGQDNGASTVVMLELSTREHLNRGNQEGKGLSGPSLGCSNEVLSREKMRDLVESNM